MMSDARHVSDAADRKHQCWFELDNGLTSLAECLVCPTDGVIIIIIIIIIIKIIIIIILIIIIIVKMIAVILRMRISS